MAPADSDPGWSDRHSSAVREAAPEVPTFAASQQEALWQQIVATPSGSSTRRVPRWKAAVAGIVTIGAVGIAGAAAANVISAHTGKGPTDAEDVELGGPGERLNPAAPDFAAVLDEATRDIRFPSTASREQSLSWEVEDLSDEQDSLVSSGALRLWTAGHAICSWSDTWAVALRTGDDATRERATDVILAARSWPSIADTDADLADESEAAWLPGLEEAVRAEDVPAAAAALGGHQACMPGLAPELGLGTRW